ncbi:MAG TPA: VOC family protein [Acidimicrobiales bacterium]|nr:VOC family protein [Acidimicrobiales bacterium]
MPEITGAVHHVNLSVSDLERSAAWYSELFGLKELARLSDPDGAWSKVILQHHSGLLIGLTQHSRNGAAPFSEILCGVDHVALTVPSPDDLSAWIPRLGTLGIESSAVKTTPLGLLVTIRDPDNIQIELYCPHG